jgi:hypothetical protein
MLKVKKSREIRQECGGELFKVRATCVEESFKVGIQGMERGT